MRACAATKPAHATASACFMTTYSYCLLKPSLGNGRKPLRGMEAEQGVLDEGPFHLKGAWGVKA